MAEQGSQDPKGSGSASGRRWAAVWEDGGVNWLGVEIEPGESDKSWRAEYEQFWAEWMAGVARRAAELVGEEIERREVGGD